ncbi:hypothetical protein CAOG_010066 [Capsaspora owczarzaki ATCC 30864]|uniref:Uncharacterized protein n=1 Tax=Capsaspora owczarzaki (strain ATCC 30864) TaxID=595528 RepID=A0A0D2UPL1_CAPO3|nr:hypothetical protein CAOG_010066 [Capsaspora owczarzaki ATCC 30864]
MSASTAPAACSLQRPTGGAFPTTTGAPDCPASEVVQDRGKRSHFLLTRKRGGEGAEQEGFVERWGPNSTSTVMRKLEHYR